jgi:Glucose-6-phosphate dehydrogenase, C-terminal domain
MTPRSPVSRRRRHRLLGLALHELTAGERKVVAEHKAPNSGSRWNHPPAVALRSCRTKRPTYSGRCPPQIRNTTFGAARGLPRGAWGCPGVDNGDVRGGAVGDRHWRWAGIPIFLRAGKKLPHHVTEVRLSLRPTPRLVFCPNPQRSILTRLCCASI